MHNKPSSEPIELQELEELNACLVRLAEVYPEHDTAVLRHNLLTASRESRLAAVADFVADLSTELRNRPYSPTIEPWQRFRTQAYRKAAWKTLRNEFKKLSEATVRTVLAENNDDYTRSRTSLAKISAKSWRVAFLSFFDMRPAFLRSSTDDSKTGTGCAELDSEIDAALNSDSRIEQLTSDAQLARTINDQMYEKEGALLECQCCFGDYAWEDICFCPESHYFCRACLKRSVEESLHGQGASLDPARCSARCISSTAEPPCTASISPSCLPYFLPPEVMVLLDNHFAKAQLDAFDACILRCPFCTYAVIDDAPRFKRDILKPLSHTPLLICALFGVFDLGVRPLVIFAALWTLFATFLFLVKIPADVQWALEQHRPTWATIFRCENPRCGRDSCLQCGRLWVGMHNCLEETISSRKVYVARRVDEAVKRTCPKCHVSFVKSGGCNKMVCTCGYKMCYVCRADICDDAYAHFCQHFRPRGGPCTECSACSLFEGEDEDAVIRAAKATAEEEWRNKIGDGISIRRGNRAYPCAGISICS
ncbi:hypothetical protein PLICRDRAFT_114762 [Plicaturopsis crispa FD-325 SS-3]|nr:hypothetical protein PLICRDRAFT_114762 [Plicaturopsis crispa FD-325 SS-3]